jgi:cytoskeletal protein RodZ
MKDATPNSPSENPQASGPITGQILRDARLAANLDLSKICNDLRLSPQVIEALEKGEYHLLPGDPYIRALLGSLGRYLNLDTASLIAGYNKEIGATHAAPSVAPYKDRAHTYTTAHKQIFIFVFIGLFILLVLLMGKLNKPDPDAAIQGTGINPAPAESLTIPQDSVLESHSLAPDSILDSTVKENLSTDTLPIVPNKAAVKVPVPAVTAPAAQPTPAVTASPALAPPGPASPATTAPVAVVPIPEASPLNVVVIKPLIDSVGVKVLRTGKEDFSTMLRLGKQMQVSNSDTIVVFISKRKAVEVNWAGKSVIPGRKRFKIYGTTLKTY